jgi:hypothetical protein
MFTHLYFSQGFSSKQITKSMNCRLNFYIAAGFLSRIIAFAWSEL